MDILSSAYDIRTIQFVGLKHLIPYLWQLSKGIIWSDVSFSWFGKLHAFFAVLLCKLFNKRSIVMAGGDDVAKQTATGRPYGTFSHPIKKWFGRFIFKYADLILAISEYNYKEIINNTTATPERVKLVYHGFDPNIFQRRENISKKDIVVTVGEVDPENYWRKGLYLIKAVASLMWKVQFYIIGPHKKGAIRRLQKDKPDNLFLPGALYGQELIKMLSRAKVYLQLSEWESFGCALAEAMLCECVPVVTRYGALPEVVGECGLYTDSFDPGEIANKIREAIERQAELGPKARQRIIDKFPLEKRREKLIALTGGMLER